MATTATNVVTQPYSDFLVQIGGRKFFLVILSLLVNAFLLVFDFIEPGVYAGMFTATVVAYITGNVAQKAIVNQPVNTVIVDPAD